MSATDPAPPPELVSEDRPLPVLAEPTPAPIIARPLEVAEAIGVERAREGMQRFRDRLSARMAARDPAPTESSPERHAREVREADVIEAARRSQAEIRRHVDAYLSEHFESMSADVASIVVDRVMQRVSTGLAAMEETQQIQINRIAASMRAELRSFLRGFSATPQRARRAAKARRAKKR